MHSYCTGAELTSKSSFLLLHNDVFMFVPPLVKRNRKKRDNDKKQSMNVIECSLWVQEEI